MPIQFLCFKVIMSSAIVPAINSNQSSGFSPKQIPGCALWLDAADSSTLSLTGSSVTQWRDKSGAATHATAGTATYPVYQLGGPGGRPIISLRGTNDYFLVANNFSPAQYPSICYFVVMRIATTQTTNFAGVLSTYNGTTWGRSLGVGNGGASLQQGYFGNLQNIVTCVKETWLVVGLQFVSTTSATMYQNGTATAAFASPTGTNTLGFKIGSYSNQGSPAYSTHNAQVDIGEILVYDSVLDTSQRQQIEGYLVWKWGLTTNIPAIHPYKLNPLHSRSITPPNISGCQVWFDAADASTVTLSGSNVTQWRDKSGFGRTTSNGPFSSPVYSNLGVTYSGSNGMVMTGTLPASYDIFVVGAPLASAASWRTLFQVAGGTATHTILVETGSTRLGAWFNQFNQFGTLVWPATPAILFARLNANLTINASMNGTVALTAATPALGAASSVTLNLGNANGAGQPWGTLNEFIIYSGPLTTSQRQQIEGYLAHKWKLQGNLPSVHSFKLYQSLQTLFNPLQIANSVLWLDAADPSTVVLSGSNVTQWTDKSGVGNHATQPTLANQPTYSNNAVVFGTPKNLLCATSASRATETIFAVLTVTSGSSTLFGSITSLSNTFSGPGGRSILFDPGTPASMKLIKQYVSVTLNGPFYSYNARSLIGSVNNGTTASIFSNGTQSATGSFVAYTANLLTIIGRNGSDGTSYFKGEINEIILYSSALTVDERRQVEGYLAWKWGLRTRLPTTHPFYTTKP
jgi:hypothetical protein